MAIFMHLYWERWAIVNVLLWPMTAIMVLLELWQQNLNIHFLHAPYFL